jgi:hypothetical protein
MFGFRLLEFNKVSGSIAYLNGSHSIWLGMASEGRRDPGNFEGAGSMILYF